MQQLDDLYAVRRTNARHLIAKVHGSSNFAKLIGTSISVVSQLTSKNPIRKISEKTARSIEKKLQLTEGYLDSPQFNNFDVKIEDKVDPVSEIIQVATINQINSERLALCIEKVIHQNKKLSPKQIAVTSTALYNLNGTQEQEDAVLKSILQLL